MKTTTEQALLNNENNKINAQSPKPCFTCGGKGYIVCIEAVPHQWIALKHQRITTCEHCKGSGER